MAVPQWVLDLQARRDEITTELAAINNNETNIGDRNLPGAKPDVDGDGGGTRGTEYRLSLYTELAQINEALRGAAETIAAETAIDNSDDFATVETIME